MLRRYKGHRHDLFVVCNGLCSIAADEKLGPFSSCSSDLNNDILEFTALSKPNTFQWNSIIKTHVDSGFSDTALSIFTTMRQAGSWPDHFTFPLVNRAVSLIPKRFSLGEAIHCLGIQMGFGCDVYFCNTMMEVYVRNDFISLARRLFDEMCVRDVVSWTTIISGYIQIGVTRESNQLFHMMRTEGLEPNSVTLAVVLRACGLAKDVVGGTQLYAFSIKRGFQSYELVENSILTVFSKAGWFEELNKIFDSIQNRSTVPWNIVMSAYSTAGNVSKVVDCYENIRAEYNPSHETLTLVISAFSKCGDLCQGQKVHCYAVKSGQLDMVLETSLVDFYARCVDLASGVQLFEEIKVKNSCTWSVMMWGLIQNSQFAQAIDLFWRMQNAGLEPSADTLRGLVVTYTHFGALQLGKATHGYLIRNNFFDDPDKTILETSIVNMYAKCGSIFWARRCFDGMVIKDTIAWSSMIEGYAIHGLALEALQLFHQMQEEGIAPNSITFLSLLSACSHSGLVSEGCEVLHSMIRKFRIKPELSHFTCMVDLLGRSGKLDEALRLINFMTAEPDARIWGALLSSCRTYLNRKLSTYVAQKLFTLEPDNVGYHVVLSNIHASDDKWNVVETIRKTMGAKDFKKEPGWSCMEERCALHMFIAGDRSHPQIGEIYEALEYLSRHIEERRSI